jgi:hypothetical protein
MDGGVLDNSSFFIAGFQTSMRFQGYAGRKKLHITFRLFCGVWAAL